MIRESSDISQLRYIPTTQDPTDDASRGLKIEHLVQGRWIDGPKSLWEAESEWAVHPVDIEMVDDIEVKENFKENAVVTEDTVKTTKKMITHFSSWKRLKVAVGWILKFKMILVTLSQKRKQLTSASTSGDGSQLLDVNLEIRKLKATIGDQKLSVDDLSEAEMSIVSFSQSERFHVEIAALSSGKSKGEKREYNLQT